MRPHALATTAPSPDLSPGLAADENGCAQVGEDPAAGAADADRRANHAQRQQRDRGHAHPARVIQAKPFAPSHARMPVAPPTAAAAVVAPIAHCTHTDKAYRRKRPATIIAKRPWSDDTGKHRRRH